jgi:hypothetical protein
MVTVENKLATSVLPQIKVMQFIQQATQMQTVHVSVREVVGVKQLDPQKGRKMAQYLTPFLQQNRKVNVSLEDAGPQAHILMMTVIPLGRGNG